MDTIYVDICEENDTVAPSDDLLSDIPPRAPLASRKQISNKSTGLHMSRTILQY